MITWTAKGEGTPETQTKGLKVLGVRALGFGGFGLRSLDAVEAESLSPLPLGMSSRTKTG